MDLGKLLGQAGQTIQSGLSSLLGSPQVQASDQPSQDPRNMKLTMVANPNLGQAPAAPTTAPQPPVSTVPAASNGLGRNPDIPQKPMSNQVKSAIQSAAKEFNVPANLLFDVGYGEGGYRPDAANTSPEGQMVGVPRGLFQFTPGTWNQDLVNYSKGSQTSFKNWSQNGKAPDVNDPVANARAAAYLISHGQLARWTASKPNWGRFYTSQELDPYYSQAGQ